MTRSTNVGAVRFAVRFAQNAPEMGVNKALHLRCVSKRTAPPLAERVPVPECPGVPGLAPRATGMACDQWR